ncbi:serine/threonine-protein kinase [Saccharopolyspora sp. NPDC047091]|uniref:serine/threonine-protein kinase n=1 Tax=Saccharopolyspora sp. NPDC047091 TaxID=3155924 RepID=UPI0033FA481E
MDDAAPKLLGGRYRLGRRLGRGGMSVVHRAVDTRLGRPVAVKVFRSDADEASRRRFEDEARLLARLSHPGLVTVHDAGAETGDGDPYLVMQLVEGRTLSAAMRAGAIDPGEVAELGRRLAEVLAYVHANGIVHRDVKPSNVLITDAGEVFLADFGISLLVHAVGRMTDSGVVMGSAHYMAPEQVRDEDVDYAADVYALGLVLLECATGRAEYDGTKTEAAVARLTREPRVPDWLPNPLAEVLLAMTAYDPEQRPSAARCARLLAAEPAGPGATAKTESPQRRSTDTAEFAPAPEPAPAAPRPRRRALLLGAAGLLVLVLGAAALLVPGASAPERPVLPPESGPPGVARLPADLDDLDGLVRG